MQYFQNYFNQMHLNKLPKTTKLFKMFEALQMFFEIIFSLEVHPTNGRQKSCSSRFCGTAAKIQ